MKSSPKKALLPGGPSLSSPPSPGGPSLSSPPSRAATGGSVLVSLELSRRLFSRKTETDVCAVVCEYCVEELGIGMAWMGLLDPDTHRLTPACVFPVRVEYLNYMGMSWQESPDSRNPVAKALSTGEEWVVNDLETDAVSVGWKSMTLGLGFHSSASFPIVGDPGMAGLLSIYSGEKEFFTEDRLPSVRLLGQLAALAFERCRVIRDAKVITRDVDVAVEERTAQLEKQYVRLAALAEISLYSDNPNTVLDTIAETTARLLPATCGASVVLWDAKAQRFHTSVSTIAGQGRDSTASRAREAGGASRWIVENREPLVVPDVRRMPFPPNPVHEEYGIKAFVGVPVIAGGEVLGVLYALDCHHRKYSREDLDFLTTMANRVGAALMSARLLESERAQRRLAEALGEVASDLNSTLELPVILNHLLDHLSEILSFDCGFVLIERDGRFRSEAVRGHPICDRGGGARGIDCCGRVFRAVLQSERPYVYDDIRAGESFGCCALLEGIASVLTLPLLSADKMVGMLALGSRFPGFFSAQDAETALSFAQQAAVAVRNASLFTQVKQMAMLDPLTKIYNRGHLFELATPVFKAAIRYKRPLSVFMLDIDNFKTINDTHGHQVGDEVLRTVVERFSRTIRDIDILGRYGGDEFVILLPETDKMEAARVAERLRENTSATPIPTAAGPVQASISVGIATVTPDTPTLAALLKRADLALYQSKTAGRNLVSVDTPTFFLDETDGASTPQ